jgi:hypothetical protein
MNIEINNWRAYLVALLPQLRTRLLRIPIIETTCAQRGFSVADLRAQQHLERIGQAFVFGYHAALTDDQPTTLSVTLNTLETELRGFAFEGAAMGLSLLDQLTPWNNYRLAAFLSGPGAPHIYMGYVGAGWAFARLPWLSQRFLERLDPLLRWLAVDGYGFHQGYFNWQRYIAAQVQPNRITGYALRVFDQGLGRSLWFVKGMSPIAICTAITSFAPTRHADLWSGVGLACSYAGGADKATIAQLQQMAGQYRSHLAQGAAFAAKARQLAHTPATHTEMACAVLCGLTTDVAADLTERALIDLPTTARVPMYEMWRQRIRTAFHEEGATV